LAREGASLWPPPPAPQRRIEFYGDSITCGAGNEAPDDAGDKTMPNATITWPAG